MSEPKKFTFRQITKPAVAPIPTAPAVPAQPMAPPVVAPSTVPDAPVEVVASAPTASKAVQPVQPAVPQTAIVPAAPASPAVVSTPAAVYGDDSESLGAKDVRLPRINLVQNVGDLMKIFNPGEIVLNQQTVLVQSPKTAADKNRPIRVVVVGFRPDRWVEKVAGGALGNIVDSLQEVQAAGGTTDYNIAKATGRPLYEELAEALVLIEQPENVEDPSFNFPADGKLWAVALWSMKGSAFTAGAKVFRTARKFGWLADRVDPTTKTVLEKRSYFSGSWLLNTALKTFKTGNSAWVPVLAREGDTGPEVRELAQSALS